MRSRSQLYVLLASLCFGTTGTAQALGPEGASPLTVGAVRIAIGAALLLAVLAAVRGGLPGRRDWIPLLLAGAGVAAYQLCFFSAVRDTGVAVGTVVALGSAPALAGALTWLVDREAPGRGWALATALATVGVAVLVLAGGGSASLSFAGILLALGAGASYAVFAIGSKRMLDGGRGIQAVMAWAFTTGAVLLLPILFVADIGWLRQPQGLAMALWLGAVPTALAYLLFAAGLRHLAAGEVATLTLAEPVTATLLGVAILEERPELVAVVGMALVVAGLAVLACGAGSSGASTDSTVIAEGG